ncbi:ATP-binding cassette domain-containing protein [Phytoactinopolyspora endophytica]|uniref:ATP-binding cassette domain-containing protein n=1 Tax=Phytoactinopolyspora endophytica TaxID=1642495 RepID=UPI00101B9CE8|nr:ATP-binding cassette domain-containing protein [Phytoactinopolyspora endophytica]
MIQAKGLTKQYGDVRAVDDLSFNVEAGHVTGFLGPNGAGKTTTMRMILGLDRPTAGSVTVFGRHYANLPAPLYEVGALLDTQAMHSRRKADYHLLCLARMCSCPSGQIGVVSGFTAAALAVASVIFHRRDA